MKFLTPVSSAVKTDRGQVRDHNEDYVYCRLPADLADETAHGWLFIVADGVGGAEAGEVASRFATESTVAHYVTDNGESNLGRRLVSAMQSANTDLRQMVAERNENKRMATTMVAAVVQNHMAYLGNVGDSRGYHLHDQEMRQVTRDQSLVAKLLEEGAITAEEAEHHPHRNVILYSIGSERSPQIDLFELSLDMGDRLLLCSDGLIRHVNDEEIREIVLNNDEDTAVSLLIDLANERGGQDNISAAVISYGLDQQGRAAEEATSPVVVMSPADDKDVPQSNRSFLALYTVFLSIVQAVLIVLLWLWLRA